MVASCWPWWLLTYIWPFWSVSFQVLSGRLISLAMIGRRRVWYSPGGGTYAGGFLASSQCTSTYTNIYNCAMYDNSQISFTTVFESTPHVWTIINGWASGVVVISVDFHQQPRCLLNISSRARDDVRRGRGILAGQLGWLWMLPIREDPHHCPERDVTQ